MKNILIAVLLTVFQLNSYSQETFTSRKGSKFFPGHLDVVITVDEENVRYELFNHWYSSSYSQLRQITIPLDSLHAFNQNNDSIQINLEKNRVKLIDKKYQLTEGVRHRKLCASASTMRKISFAYEAAKSHEGIRHSHLFRYDDLNLDEATFKETVLENLRKKTK